MTAFDAVALVLLALSALAGFSRGAVRELVGLFALALSVLGTIALLPLLAPLARRLVHPSWLAAVLVAVVVFALIFTALQLLANSLTKMIGQGTVLGGVNRLGGLGFGLVRGLVLLGLFALIFTKVAPAALRPRWITQSVSFPVAEGCGRVLQHVVPKSLTLAGGLPALGAAVGAAAADPEADPQAFEPSGARTPDTDRAPADADPAPSHRRPRRIKGVKPDDHGYTGPARERIDALVEQSN